MWVCEGVGEKREIYGHRERKDEELGERWGTESGEMGVEKENQGKKWGCVYVCVLKYIDRCL